MVSVIIPTLNTREVFKSILADVAANVDEIVISDGGSTDQTLNIALEHNARIALGCEGRGWQLARGASWARCDWLFFIHADTLLPKNWQSLVEQHIQTTPDKAGYFKFGIEASGVRPRLLEIMANARTFWFGLPYGDQGLLISRKLYEQVGGFPNWPLFEDVAIVRALGRRRLCQMRGQVATCPERFEKNGYFRNFVRNISYITRFSFGADPEKLAKAYHK